MDERAVQAPIIEGRVPVVLAGGPAPFAYVNVQRTLLYLEHSLSTGLQWTVFEPNGPALWAAVRARVSDFLLGEWQKGALLGATPEEAFFVRCDETTMTQADLDNGRLTIVVGVAPTKPAEFVILQIGQWTALYPPH